MERKLASIQRIIEIRPIPEADKIVVATVLGWDIVIKKDDGFQVGDLCVYCEIDSILPNDNPLFDFLKDRNYRVKTIKLRGQISQGIVFPLSILPETLQIEEGLDVTDIIGVTKYEPNLPGVSGGPNKLKAQSTFPTYYLSKSDETRLQALWPKLKNDLVGKELVATVKMDGTSFTALYHPDKGFLACSRNYVYSDDDNYYWRMVRKYDIQNKLMNYPIPVAIQAELCTPSVQHGQKRIGITEEQIFVFNVYDINGKKYFPHDEMVKFCEEMGFPTVPVVGKFHADNMELKDFLEMSKGKYPNGHPREGIVIRSVLEEYSQVMRGRLSFKVINNDYLLKIGE